MQEEEWEMRMAAGSRGREVMAASAPVPSKYNPRFRRHLCFCFVAAAADVVLSDAGACDGKSQRYAAGTKA